MAAPRDRLPLLVPLALAVLAAGCLAADAPQSGGSPQADGADAGAGNATPTPAPEGLVATSNPDIPVLGLAVYDGVPPERVEPHVPGDYTPVHCFRSNDTEGLDLYLVVTEERHPDLLPDQEAQVRALSLVGCADRPEHTRKPDANEPPWVLLMSWSDGDAVESFLGERGFSARPAEIAIETGPDGYAFQATTPNGSTVAQGRFITPGVGAPNFLTCEPQSFRGRVVQEGPEGLASLGWNKTEAACPAEAAIAWPAESPLAEVLGPAHAPSYAIDSQVEDARYWYRVLGGG